MCGPASFPAGSGHAPSRCGTAYGAESVGRAMDMETFDQPDSGYPEEGPPGAAPDDAGAGGESAVREHAKPGSDADDAPDTDDGKATGNPKT